LFLQKWKNAGTESDLSANSIDNLNALTVEKVGNKFFNFKTIIT